MANIPMKSIKLPGLADTYTFVQIDDGLTVAGKAADAATTGNRIAALKSALLSEGTIRESYSPVATFDGCTISGSGANQGKIVSTSGNINVYVYQIGVSGSAKVTGGTAYGYYNVNPVKGETITSDGIRHIANLSDTVINMPSDAGYLAIIHSALPTVTSSDNTTSEKVEQNASAIATAPKTKSISASAFAAAPYNGLIGNLDNNSIVNISSSHVATDYPFGQSGIYTVITTGYNAGSMIQIAVRLDGKIFSRRKISSDAWGDWYGGAVDFSKTTVFSNSTEYTDFNDFPVGSIISVYNAELEHAPDGFVNFGHDNITSVGDIYGNVITFATAPNDSRIISQICIYNGTNISNPAVATRNAIRVGESAPYTYTWTQWAEFSYNGVIHATNRIIDGNNYAYTLPSADLDNLPLNSIYHLDYNCYDIIAHNPVPGQSCSVMTFGFTNNSKHASSQICISRDPTTYAPQMFIRYCVQTGTNQYQWSKWGQAAITMLDV